MERALRNRLTWGPVMLAALVGILVFDHYAERWTASAFEGLRKIDGIGGIGVTLLLMFLAPFATRECANLFTAEQVRPNRLVATLGCWLLLGHAFLTQFHTFRPIAASSFALIVVGTMIATAVGRALAQDAQQAIVRMAGTVLAALYVGGLCWFLVALRVKDGAATGGFTGSTWHVVLVLLCVKFTDIGAFFAGKAVGRHKLIAWLSPGKTWEGLIGGLLTAGAVGAVVASQINLLDWVSGACFGILIGGVGQVGDLFESMMKRDAGLKDSGASIPGFGGLLDVMDSPLLAAPFAYLLFSLFEPAKGLVGY